MITRYNDLAANERTYLAWMRTSLALIAFGFLLERFDLMVRTFNSSLSDGKVAISPMGREAGVILVVLGIIIMLLSTLRFIQTVRLIRSPVEEAYGIKGVVITGGIFILLGVFVLLYITRWLSFP
jgi:putative membrane protein